MKRKAWKDFYVNECPPSSRLKRILSFFNWTSLDIHQSVTSYLECCPYCSLVVIYSIKGVY